ncbi:MAG: 16S rRNA (cytidine(1402)-2'-O)-methyltransferase [Actinobacteria bacterium]|nr:16S rRNA (cytidine(1402)-2'-O)-methyltransferase [Actinomycetota bacterium]
MAGDDEVVYERSMVAGKLPAGSPSGIALPGRPGLLVVVGTPIGNLGDLSPRAVQALERADVIACEDTRRTRQLLSHAGIRGAAFTSLYAHNEAAKAPALVEQMASGATVAIVSDAGMPAISDPGSLLIRAAIDAGIRVTAVPGPSAALSALIVSGFDTSRFVFEGFLPRKGPERRRQLALLAVETRTAVLFESARRVGDTLKDLCQICGRERRVAVARELTKVHEEIWRADLASLCCTVDELTQLGELVIVLEGAPPQTPGAPDDSDVGAMMARLLQQGASTKEAAAAVAAALGVPRRRAYELAPKVL